MRTLTVDATPIADMGDHTGETPLWSARERALYWINVNHGAGPAVHRWDEADGAVRTWSMPERIGAVALRDDGGLIVALASGLYDLDPATGALGLRAASPLGGHLPLHEGRCDPTGRFWVASSQDDFASTGRRGEAQLCRLDGDRLTPLFAGFTIANGLAFASDGRTLYLGCSISGTVRAWDCNPATGELGESRPFATHPFIMGEESLDGAAVDSEGGYWSTIYGQGLLRRWTAAGAPDLELVLPVKETTMLAFGGKDLDTIFVTTSWMMLDEEGRKQRPELGAVYAVQAPVKGIAEPELRTRR